MKSVSKAIESGNVYIKYPDGTMLQRGIVDIPENVAGKVFPFSIPFVGTAIIIASPEYNYEITVNFTASANDKTFTIYRNGTQFGVTKKQSFQWIAIGRWK